MSKATIIIESGSKGGSLVTADIANSYNKDVFAVPGRASDIFSKGCNQLIKKNRAHLLTSAKDIVEMLNWDLKKVSNKSQQQSLFVALNEEEQLVYDFLHQNGKQGLDTIALACQLPLFSLSSLLLQMELKGILKPLPGKMYELS